MVTLQSLTAAAAIGALAGACASVWGMYRNSIRRGFGEGRFLSRMLVGASATVAMQLMVGLPLPRPPAIIILLGLAYAAEWPIIATWRAFFPGGDGSSRVIPIVLGFPGVTMGTARARIAVAVGYVVVLGLFFTALGRLDRSSFIPLSPVTGALVGVSAGLLLAIGGAWKEATRSGFELVTFLRTPLLTTLFAVGLAFFVDSYLYLALAAVGYERAAVETWKTVLAYVGWRLRNGPWC